MTLIASSGRNARDLTTYRHAFEWVPLGFDYTTNSIDDIEWVSAHLHLTARHAGFPVVQARHHSISAVVSTSLYEEWLGVIETALPASVEVPGYVGSSYRRGAYRSGQVWFAGEGAEKNNHVIVSPRAGEWLVVSAEGDFAHRNGMRLIRELLREAHLGLGGLLLHSAAGIRDGRAVAFVGGSGAGKTSLSLAYGTSTGVISTDRSVIVPGHVPWIVGSPAMFRVGFGAIEAVGRMEAAAHLPYIRPQNMFTEGVLNRSATAFASRVKLELTPMEASTFLGVRTVDAAPLGALVLPAFSRSSRSRLSGSSWDDTSGDLTEQLLHPDPTFPAEFLLGPNEPPNEMSYDESVDRLKAVATRVPLFRLTWGPDIAELRVVLGDLRRSVETSWDTTPVGDPSSESGGAPISDR